MTNGFELDSNDVISLDEDGTPVEGTTFKAKQLIVSLAGRRLDDEQVKAWAVDGAECEVLMSGKGWQKGKIKLSLHFIPDKPQSPLDDLRSELNI